MSLESNHGDETNTNVKLTEFENRLINYKGKRKREKHKEYSNLHKKTI